MSALAPWHVLATDEFVPTAEETRGLRGKQWVADTDGTTWLRKSPRSSRPTEPVVETLCASLARAVGLDAPETHACIWEGQRGILVMRFGDAHEELHEGHTLLARSKPGDYDSDRHELHSLDAVRACLEEWEQHNVGRRSLCAEFANMLALDLWVGNGDRHQGNWGILLTGDVDGPTDVSVRLAPVFDTAACLGAELDESKFSKPWDPSQYERYIAGCPSGFGDGAVVLAMRQVAAQVSEWPEWRANSARWHQEFAGVLPGVRDWLREVPADWLSHARRDVILELLRRRLDWMKGVL